MLSNRPRLLVLFLWQTVLKGLKWGSYGFYNVIKLSRFNSPYKILKLVNRPRLLILLFLQSSIRSTGPGLFGGGVTDGEEGGASHLQFLLVTLGGVAVVFLAICVTIFVVWRR